MSRASLVLLLREACERQYPYWCRNVVSIMRGAADRIEELEREVATLRGQNDALLARQKD